MKNFSVLVLMMFVVSFSQVVVSSDEDGLRSPKYKADKRAALREVGESPKQSISPKSPTGRFIGDYQKGKGKRDNMAQLEGLSVKEALEKARS